MKGYQTQSSNSTDSSSIQLQLHAIRNLGFQSFPPQSPRMSPKQSPRNSGSFSKNTIRNLHVINRLKQKFVDTAELVRVLLLEEMVARVMKIQIAAILRVTRNGFNSSPRQQWSELEFPQRAHIFTRSSLTSTPFFSSTDRIFGHNRQEGCTHCINNWR